jgi:hypothetical protein
MHHDFHHFLIFTTGISYSTPTVSFFKSDAERHQWQHPGVDSPYPSLNTSPDVIPTESARAQLLGTLAKNRDTEELLQHITTDNVARDMLRITEAFGFEKLQYWGISCVDFFLYRHHSFMNCQIWNGARRHLRFTLSGKVKFSRGRSTSTNASIRKRLAVL